MSSIKTIGGQNNQYSQIKGTQNEYMFAIKSLMQANPYTVLTTAILVSVP
jgi:hypothetical protein